MEAVRGWEGWARDLDNVQDDEQLYTCVNIRVTHTPITIENHVPGKL